MSAARLTAPSSPPSLERGHITRTAAEARQGEIVLGKWGAFSTLLVLLAVSLR